MARAGAIPRSVLSDEVKDRLLQAILAGRYPPGSRIVETRAAREFGTSQAPVREALRDLEALGLVELAPFRGARVRRPSTPELLEAFVIRSELEALGVRLAAPRLTDAELDELSGYVDRMHAAAERDDPHEEAAADASFHGRLVDLSGNGTLRRVWRQLEPFSRTYITIVVPGADRRRIADLHIPLLEALRARDAERAVAAVRRHFEDARSMLAGLWAEADQREPAQRPTRVARSRSGHAPTRDRRIRREAAVAQTSERTT